MLKLLCHDRAVFLARLGVDRTARWPATPGAFLGDKRGSTIQDRNRAPHICHTRGEAEAAF
jgi:hypothetical protein